MARLIKNGNFIIKNIVKKRHMVETLSKYRYSAVQCSAVQGVDCDLGCVG